VYQSFKREVQTIKASQRYKPFAELLAMYAPSRRLYAAVLLDFQPEKASSVPQQGRFGCPPVNVQHRFVKHRILIRLAHRGQIAPRCSVRSIRFSNDLVNDAEHLLVNALRLPRVRLLRGTLRQLNQPLLPRIGGLHRVRGFIAQRFGSVKINRAVVGGAATPLLAPPQAKSRTLSGLQGMGARVCNKGPKTCDD